MKNFVLLICLIFAGLYVQAAKLRVNNELVPSGNLHSNFNSAHVAASAGDTIYIEGSGTSYGSINLNKRLVIIGPGYFNGQNLKTLTTALQAVVGTIDFGTGSANSLVMGMKIRNVNMGVDSITLQRNWFFVDWPARAITFGSNLTKPTLIQNIFSIDPNVIMFDFGNWVNNISNMLFLNNIIYSDSGTGDFIVAGNAVILFSAIIENNTFRISNFSSLTNGSAIRNNIMEIKGPGTAPSSASTSHNYTNKTTWLGCNLCSTSVNMATNFYSTVLTTIDGRHQLVLATAAKTASTTGGEIGAFGGASPYVLSGQPTVTSIYEISMPSIANSGTQINVTIKAKRNP